MCQTQCSTTAIWNFSVGVALLCKPCDIFIFTEIILHQTMNVGPYLRSGVSLRKTMVLQGWILGGGKEELFVLGMNMLLGRGLFPSVN